MIALLVVVVLGLVGAFVGSAVRGGLALTASVGLFLCALQVYLGIPTLGFGLGLFATSTALFVLAGGMEDR